MLYVSVVSASGIPAKNFVSGLSSTFIKVELLLSSSSNNSRQEYRTNVCRNTLSPTWYQQFVFELREHTQQQQQLVFTCYSHGNVYNSIIGRAALPIGSIVKELEEKVYSRKDGEFELTTAGEEYDEKVFKGNRVSKTLTLYNNKKKGIFNNNNNSNQNSIPAGELTVHLSLDLTEEQLAYLRKQNSLDNNLLQQQLQVRNNDDEDTLTTYDEDEESSLEVESYAEDTSYTISQKGLSLSSLVSSLFVCEQDVNRKLSSSFLNTLRREVGTVA